MRATGFIFAFTASILVSPPGSFAIPCASDYAAYRQELITDKWTPVAVENSIKEFTEVSTGSRIATAKWLNPDRRKTIIFILWWQEMKLCVSPQFSVSPE